MSRLKELREIVNRMLRENVLDADKLEGAYAHLYGVSLAATLIEKELLDDVAQGRWKRLTQALSCTQEELDADKPVSVPVPTIEERVQVIELAVKELATNGVGTAELEAALAEIEAVLNG